MSELQRLIDALQETDATIVHLSNMAAERPNDDILQINAASVAKRQQDLVRRIDYSLNANFNELVRYRIVRGRDGTYPAKAVAAAMMAFQELVTSVFDALRTSPKQRYRPSAESVELSTFDFVGAATGSVVISLAAPSEIDLFDNSQLEQTFKLVEQALSARESGDLNILAQEIGIASISKAYAWAEINAGYGIDTVIQWGRSYGSYNEVTITRQDAEIVKEVIENKSDEAFEELELSVVLLGFDGSTSYFHVESLGDKMDLKGSLSSSIPKQWTTGFKYKAKLLKTSQIRYATGEEKVHWTLLSLEPIQSGGELLTNG